MSSTTSKNFSQQDKTAHKKSTKMSSKPVPSPIKISRNIQSYYSCLLKDIETRKFHIKEKSEEKSSKTGFSKPVNMRCNEIQKVHTNGGITGVNGNDLSRMLKDLEKQRLYMCSNNGIKNSRKNFGLSQLKWHRADEYRDSGKMGYNPGDHLFVIDCRFPYEFRGGHIKGAINISDPKVIEFLFIENHRLFTSAEFLHYLNTFRDTSLNTVKTETIVGSFKKLQAENESRLKRMKQLRPKALIKRIYTSYKKAPTVLQNNSAMTQIHKIEEETSIERKMYIPIDYDADSIKLHPSIQTTKTIKDLSDDVTIVFYCEFSSKRAPDMYNHLRKLDRSANVSCYPNLFYNKLYLLESGYSVYVKNHKELSSGEGNRYTEMTDPKFETELKKANILLSKQWNHYNKTPTTSHTNLKYSFKAFSLGESKLFF